MGRSGGGVGAIATGLLAGLSIGREGTTVQVGAGVMAHARRWLSPRSGSDAHDLMVAGPAAGIAAALSTPLGRIVFALEQLSRRRNMSHSALVISSIVLAGLVAVSVFGNEIYFGRLRVQVLPWSLLLPGRPVVLTAGRAGAGYAPTRALPEGDADRLFSLMACAQLARTVARLMTPPLCLELAALLPLPHGRPPHCSDLDRGWHAARANALDPKMINRVVRL